MSENRKDIYYDEGALRILEALGAVDEELLERCGEAPEPKGSTEKVVEISKHRKRRKPLWKMGRAWAACLGLLAVGFISWNGLRLIAPKGSSNSTGSMSGGAADQSQNLSADTSAAETVREVESEVTASMEEAEGAADTAKDPAAAEADRYNDNNTGAQSSDGGSGMKQQSEMSEKFSEEESLTVDRSSEAVKYDTEEAVRGWMPLGAYIPPDLPEGYHIETAFINLERQSATMIWLRGMDHIMISVSSVEPGTVETVDITKPETYDERLYEVPYAESVPKEYWESVDNPVFDFSDMDSETGLELVSSRMISYDDAGDTDTPRGSFSVLIDNEVLLHFNGRGTPEEIWNMLCSIKR